MIYVNVPQTLVCEEIEAFRFLDEDPSGAFLQFFEVVVILLKDNSNLENF